MDNTIGGIRRGWAAIRGGYQRLFNEDARVYVKFFDSTSHAGEGFRLFVGRERGVCEKPTGKLDLRIRTSRLFVRREGGWHQLHDHGLIEEPKLLEAYQRMIFGAPLDAPA